MTVSRLFSIVFNSACLLFYYTSNLKPNRSDSGALSLLVKSFISGPQLVNVDQVFHHQGNCFYCIIPEGFISDLQGWSSLLVLENSVMLSQPHTRDLNEIIGKGAGRYLHVEDKLFFSPSDNAEKSEVLSRNYQILDSLSVKPQCIENLLQLNRNENLKNRSAHFLFRKLLGYFPDKITFNGVSELSKNLVAIFKLTINLEQWHLSSWHCQNLTIDYQQAGIDNVDSTGVETTKTTDHYHFTISQLSIDGIEGHYNVEFSVAIDENYDFRPTLIHISHINSLVKNGVVNDSVNGLASSLENNLDKLIIDLSLNWQRQTLTGFQFHSDSLDTLRILLLESMGDDEMTYRTWLANTISDLTDVSKGISLKMARDDQQTIIRCLSPRSWIKTISMQADRKADTFHLTLGDTSSQENVS